MITENEAKRAEDYMRRIRHAGMDRAAIAKYGYDYIMTLGWTKIAASTPRNEWPSYDQRIALADEATSTLITIMERIDNAPKNNGVQYAPEVDELLRDVWLLLENWQAVIVPGYEELIADSAAWIEEYKALRVAQGSPVDDTGMQ